MITELRLKRMIKVISGKLLIASVVGAVVLGTFGYALADTADKSIEFKDVPKTYWGAEYIKFSASKSIIKGYQQTDGSYIFAPESAVTYEEAATMLYRALNAAGDLQSTQDFQPEYATVLTENKIAEWAKPTISYCLKTGIVDQSELTLFTDDQGKGQKAPRIQVAIWAAKAMNMQNTAAYSLPYTDVTAIGDKALPYIDMLYRHGIMKGSLQPDGTTAFLPQNGVKRAEFAAISNRVYDAMNGEKNISGGNYDLAKETVSYRGQVESVDTAKNCIQMTDAVSGLTRNIYMAPDATLLVNGEIVSSGITGIKSAVEGKNIIVSTLTGAAGTVMKQVLIDTQPYALKGTIKSVDAIGTNNKMVGIALEANKGQIIYYIADAKTSSTTTLATGTLIQFIADGIHLVEIK